MLHALKTEIGYFQEVVDGIKTFEVRKNDRPFQVSDDLVLQEWNAEDKKYTGREWKGKIIHILANERFCKKGYCILGIKEKEDY